MICIVTLFRSNYHHHYYHLNKRIKKKKESDRLTWMTSLLVHWMCRQATERLTDLMSLTTDIVPCASRRCDHFSWRRTILWVAVTLPNLFMKRLRNSYRTAIHSRSFVSPFMDANVVSERNWQSDLYSMVCRTIPIGEWYRYLDYSTCTSRAKYYTTLSKC